MSMDKPDVPQSHFFDDASRCFCTENRFASERKQWFVMRDLKRSNAKVPAYLLLASMQVEVFTPMKWVLRIRAGKRVREQIPFISDLLFVHDTAEALNPIVSKTPTLQYRYRKGAYCEPVTVPDRDMQRFIHAIGTTESPRFYLPEEITPSMYGRRIRIVGGPLDGYEGSLITTRGSRVKRLLVELPRLLAVGVEVSPEYVQVVG